MDEGGKVIFVITRVVTTAVVTIFPLSQNYLSMYIQGLISKSTVGPTLLLVCVCSCRLKPQQTEADPESGSA